MRRRRRLPAPSPLYLGERENDYATATPLTTVLFARLVSFNPGALSTAIRKSFPVASDAGTSAVSLTGLVAPFLRFRLTVRPAPSAVPFAADVSGDASSVIVSAPRAGTLPAFCTF